MKTREQESKDRLNQRHRDTIARGPEGIIIINVEKNLDPHPELGEDVILPAIPACGKRRRGLWGPHASCHRNLG